VEKKLVVHIGLPKTATTMLQTHFFPQFAGYLGRSFVPEEDGVVNGLRDIKEDYLHGKDWEEALADWADKLDFSELPVQIVSEEALVRNSPKEKGVSFWPLGPTGRGEIPRRGGLPVTIFLAKLRDFLPSDVSLFTVVTLRNQADFLASLLAQNLLNDWATVHDGVGPIFNRIIQNDDDYVDFYRLVVELEKVSGPSQHLTLLFEDGVERNVQRIEEFANVSISAVAKNSEPPNKKNPRRIDEETWNAGFSELGSQSKWAFQNSRMFRARRVFPSGLRAWAHPLSQYLGRLLERTVRSRATWRQVFVTMSDEERSRMREHCAPTNKLLAEHLNRDLTSLGY
jgi:hypothetical protein